MEEDLNLGFVKIENDGVCNMSWTEEGDFSEETCLGKNKDQNYFRQINLKKRFLTDSGYFTFDEPQTHSQDSQGSAYDDDFLTVEKENEIFENEDFQKLITGEIIKTADVNICQIAKKPRIFHQEAFEDKVKGALAKLDIESNLIGDFSRPHTLPVVNGRHQDLNSITASTLVDLLNGKFSSHIDSFQLLDCRFPYEYRGGHIRGAKNIYMKNQIDTLLLEAMNGENKENDSGTHVIIFHCEFSSERGPKLARYLRSKDREHNTYHYPKLTFPEIYLLDGGYKEFYKMYPTICVPQEYLPMLHPDFTEELKHFKAKSKSENNTKRKTERRPIKLKSSEF